jgi:hypothetical protein
MTQQECVNNLIKAYGMCTSIAALTSALKRLETPEADLRRAFRSQIVPRAGRQEHVLYGKDWRKRW